VQPLKRDAARVDEAPRAALTCTKALRGDAERNRKRLVEAAGCAFAELGFGVSVEEIARRAGLGKGTVFRRFPTKDDLVAAIVCDRMDELQRFGDALLEEDESGESIHQFMMRAVAILSQDRGLLEAIHGLSCTNVDVQSAKHMVVETVGALLAREQRAGFIRSDIAACDVMLLTAAVSHIAAPFHAIDSDIWTRYLDLVFDGLRPDAAHPCSHAPPTEEQMMRAATADVGLRRLPGSGPAPTV
jgi:AcrR family transcriptional regulator